MASSLLGNRLSFPSFAICEAGHSRSISTVVRCCLTRGSHSGRGNFRLGVHAKVTFAAVRAFNENERSLPEYDPAIDVRDVQTTLPILESLEASGSEASSLPYLEEGNCALPASVPVSEEELLLPRQQEAELWKVLDACFNAADLRLVGRTYDLLQRRGMLPNFGKYKSIVAAEGTRNVSPAVLLESSGLEATKLSPKKWGMSGSSAFAFVALLALFSILVNNNIDVRPILVIVLATAVADAIYVGGAGIAQVLSLWPPYRKRVLVHEAGHVLAAYLLGCPVRGIFLDAFQALRMGIQGQAGTQFWDETLEDELREGRLTNASFDRYCMVLFAGIAAEALVYGEAEGGENDENLYKSIVSILRPPWTPSEMSNQARWAVLQSYKLLRKHRSAYDTVVTSLEEGASLGTIVRRIEDGMFSSFATS
eukprot:c27195_g1_i4 orf=268-1539(+)